MKRNNCDSVCGATAKRIFTQRGLGPSCRVMMKTGRAFDLFCDSARENTTQFRRPLA